MSDNIFWLLVSTGIVVLGVMLMVFGWLTTEYGGWACVIGLLTICTGGIIAGAFKESEDKRKK
jgi:hypothetical protein